MPCGFCNIMKSINLFLSDGRQSYLISPNGDWQVNAVMYLDIDDLEYVVSITNGENTDGTTTRFADDETFALIILKFF